MLRTLTRLATALTLAIAWPAVLSAHCQIPCGIYDDQLRIQSMLEDVTTVEKSMNELAALSKENPKDWNQIVRWVMNKEHHADRLTDTVTSYFLAQRIKPTTPQEGGGFAKYSNELSLLHRIMVQAMKAKQTTDVKHCEQLRKLIEQFRASYMGE